MKTLVRLDRRRALGRLGACCGSIATLGLFAACESRDVESRVPSQRPLMDTDEAGLWQVLEEVERDIAVSPRRIRDNAFEEYVRGIACTIAGSHCEDLRVDLIRAPYFNASMAPNGMMQIWSGGLLRMENEAQLAAVIAHETVHFVDRHSIENFRRLKNNMEAATFLGMGIVMVGGGPLANLAYMGAIADLLAFSRDQEQAADSGGLKQLAEAGYAPDEMAAVWRNELAERNTDPDREADNLFLSTHPAAQERLATMSSAAATLKMYGQRAGAGDYQSRLAPLREMFLEDELQLRQPERSLHLLARLRRAAPGADVDFYDGEVRRLRSAAGDQEKARKAYSAAIAASPEYAKPWRGLGMLERAAGDNAAARAAFTHYLQLEPEARDADYIRGYIAQTS